MHFAYPPRKTSNPPPYLPRTPRFPIPNLRRHRTKIVAIFGLVLIAFILWVSRSGKSRSRQHVPVGKPPVIIVTVLDEQNYSKEYLDTIKENRILYAVKNGYQAFFPKVGDYDLREAPDSWTKVVATRHALTKYPDCYYVWFVDQDAYIMDGAARVEDFLMKSSRLESLMLRDVPIVPPDSIIRTFSHLKAQDVDFILTQDYEGLSTGSFLVRNGEWAKFFLETWFDPIYRSYNFQKAETHALEHIVQWHPTILSRLALVPQRTINSYSLPTSGDEYEAGDVLVRFANCAKVSTASCESDSQRFLGQWRKSFGAPS